MNHRLKNLSILIFLIVFSCILIASVSATQDETGYVYWAYSDDFQFAVKSTDDNTIYYFDSGKNAIPWSYTIGRHIGSVAITPDGKYVAVGSANGLIWLFDRDGEIQWKRTFGDSVIKSIAFTPDGQHIDASNIFNQAFYITFKGNLAPRQIPSTGTTIPTITPAVIPTQFPSVVFPLSIELPFGYNGDSVFLIVAGLCIALFVLYLTRYHKPQKRFIAICKNAITLRNLTIFSLLLIIVSGIISWYYPSQYSDLLNTAFIVGILGVIIAYFLYSVLFWIYDSKFIAILMIAIPFCIHFFATNVIPGTMNTIMFILIIFTVYAILSAIVLAISEKIQGIILTSLLKSKRRHYPEYPLNFSFTIIGIIVISIIMMSLGSSAVLSENVNSALKSTTNYGSGSQYSTVVPPTQTFSVTPVWTTQTSPPSIPIPVTTINRETGMTVRSFDYVLRGRTSTISLNLYSGVYQEITSKSLPSTCIRYNYDTRSCTNEEIQQYYRNYIDEPNQKKYLDNLVQSIKSQTSNRDDQVRIAISLVQQIPYDYSRLNSPTFKMRTPYEVLYDDRGICSEKSMLLAYLLRELGYGVVLFEFPAQNHMAIGVKSPSQYGFKNTGYAFVESAAPSIPTNDQGDYVGVGKLTGAPTVLSVSTGDSFDSISEEYQDAQRYNTLISMGSVLDESSYYQWVSVVQKYGIDKVLNS